jgi:hypothetical protein
VCLCWPQVELYDSSLDLWRNQLSIAEWDMLREGLPPDVISSQMAALSAVAPTELYGTAQELPTPLGYR